MTVSISQRATDKDNSKLTIAKDSDSVKVRQIKDRRRGSSGRNGQCDCSDDCELNGWTEPGLAGKRKYYAQLVT